MTVVVVTGPPASGKTTLARAVADALGWPLYTKDTFKELLYDELGTGDLDWSAKLGSAAMELLQLVLRTELAAGRPVVVEANFRRLALPAASGRAPAVVQVFCRDTAAALNERYRSRDRHPGHLDELREIDPDEYAPLPLGGRLFHWRVGDDLDGLVAAVRAAVA